MKGISKYTVIVLMLALTVYAILIFTGVLREKDQHQNPEVGMLNDEKNIPEYNKKTRLTICAVGDIIMHMKMIEAAKASRDSYDFMQMFEDIKPYIEKADLAFGNLEVPIVDRGQGYSGYPTFKCPEELLETLKKTGFDVLTTANNHCLDAGTTGAMNTINKLEVNNGYSRVRFKNIPSSLKINIHYPDITELFFHLKLCFFYEIEIIPSLKPFNYISK